MKIRIFILLTIMLCCSKAWLMYDMYKSYWNYTIKPNRT